MLDEPTFKGRRIGHDCLPQESTESDDQYYRNVPPLDWLSKGNRAVLGERRAWGLAVARPPVTRKSEDSAEY